MRRHTKAIEMPRHLPGKADARPRAQGWVARLGGKGAPMSTRPYAKHVEPRHVELLRTSSRPPQSIPASGVCGTPSRPHPIRIAALTPETHTPHQADKQSAPRFDEMSASRRWAPRGIQPHVFNGGGPGRCILPCFCGARYRTAEGRTTIPSGGQQSRSVRRSGNPAKERDMLSMVSGAICVLPRTPQAP